MNVAYPHICVHGPDDQIIKPVAIHVAASTHRLAAQVTVRFAENSDPARSEVGQIDGARKSRTAEDEIALS